MVDRRTQGRPIAILQSQICHQALLATTLSLQKRHLSRMIRNQYTTITTLVPDHCLRAA